MTSHIPEKSVLAELRKAADLIGGLRAFGRKHGISAAFLSRVIAGDCPPSDRICQTIGLRKSVRYERMIRDR
jgi:hypothetical protein